MRPRWLTLFTLAVLTLLLSCQTSPDLQGGVDADFEDGLDAYKRGNYATALSTWQPLAEQGDARAQYNLGLMYYHGLGIPQDHAEAVHWFRQAAEEGYARAQGHLGAMHYEGSGVPRDYVQAHMWVTLAAVQGNEEIKQFRDQVAKHMTPTQLAEAQRLAREWTPKQRQ